jgi:tetraacyldisaccharide 4'-kinase
VLAPTRARWAEHLERGHFDGAPATLASRLWSAISNPCRRMELPRGAKVIGVGGATLGGAGKTPVVGALARALSARVEVAVVAHGYRSRARASREVRLDDDVRAVGDDALALRRELRDLRAPVFVGRRRGDSARAAANRAEWIVVDGLLQTRPERLFSSLLVLDGDQPFGAAHCPPRGDLRASLRALGAACDLVLAGPGSATELEVRAALERDVPVLRYAVESHGARTPDGRRVSFAELAATRLGVVLAVARPERMLGWLRTRGVSPERVVVAADHEVPRAPRREHPPRAWLTTAKCATKLGDRFAGAPVWVLERKLVLPAELGSFLGVSLG